MEYHPGKATEGKAPHMKADLDAFKKTMGCFASGVTVVTARGADGSPVGLTVSAFCSLSLEPPLVLICLGHRTSGLDAFRQGPFVVNVLSEAQREISVRFAQKRDDRFETVDHAPGANGAPVIAGCLAHIECESHSVLPGGDHDIIVGAVTNTAILDAARPLIHFRGTYHSLA